MKKKNLSDVLKILMVWCLILVNFHGYARAAAPLVGAETMPRPDRLVLFATDVAGTLVGSMRLARGPDGAFTNLEICDSRLEAGCYPLLSPQEEPRFRIFLAKLNEQLALHNENLKKHLFPHLLKSAGVYALTSLATVTALAAMYVTFRNIGQPLSLPTNANRSFLRTRFFLADTLTTTTNFFSNLIFLTAWGVVGGIKVRNEVNAYQAERDLYQSFGQATRPALVTVPVHVDAEMWQRLLALTREAAAEAIRAGAGATTKPLPTPPAQAFSGWGS